jgi:hypothetical protein
MKPDSRGPPSRPPLLGRGHVSPMRAAGWFQLIDFYALISAVFLKHHVNGLYHCLVLVSFAMNDNLVLQLLRAIHLHQMFFASPLYHPLYQTDK